MAVALGSNLGDRRGHLAAGLEGLAAHLADLKTSTIIETDPVGVPDAQPRYLNAVAVGRTTLLPQALLDVLLELERSRGRRRPSGRAARTLDLDVILYGDRVLTTPTLEIPHPRFRERRFVLEPLAELAPEWRDPVSGRRVADLLGALDSRATG